jgi:hypothetical protein
VFMHSPMQNFCNNKICTCVIIKLHEKRAGV